MSFYSDVLDSENNIIPFDETYLHNSANSLLESASGLDNFLASINFIKDEIDYLMKKQKEALSPFGDNVGNFLKKFAEKNNLSGMNEKIEEITQKHGSNYDGNKMYLFDLYYSGLSLFTHNNKEKNKSIIELKFIYIPSESEKEEVGFKKNGSNYLKEKYKATKVKKMRGKLKYYVTFEIEVDSKGAIQFEKITNKGNRVNTSIYGSEEKFIKLLDSEEFKNSQVEEFLLSILQRIKEEYKVDLNDKLKPFIEKVKSIEEMNNNEVKKIKEDFEKVANIISTFITMESDSSQKKFESLKGVLREEKTPSIMGIVSNLKKIPENLEKEMVLNLMDEIRKEIKVIGLSGDKTKVGGTAHNKTDYIVKYVFDTSAISESIEEVRKEILNNISKASEEKTENNDSNKDNEMIKGFITFTMKDGSNKLADTSLKSTIKKLNDDSIGYPNNKQQYDKFMNNLNYLQLNLACLKAFGDLANIKIENLKEVIQNTNNKNKKQKSIEKLNHLNSLQYYTSSLNNILDKYYNTIAYLFLVGENSQNTLNQPIFYYKTFYEGGTKSTAILSNAGILEELHNNKGIKVTYDDISNGIIKSNKVIELDNLKREYRNNIIKANKPFNYKEFYDNQEVKDTLKGILSSTNSINITVELENNYIDNLINQKGTDVMFYDDDGEKKKLYVRL